jgi:hypothetical protein
LSIAVQSNGTGLSRDGEVQEIKRHNPVALIAPTRWMVEWSTYIPYILGVHRLCVVSERTWAEGVVDRSSILF